MLVSINLDSRHLGIDFIETVKRVFYSALKDVRKINMSPRGLGILQQENFLSIKLRSS